MTLTEFWSIIDSVRNDSDRADGLRARLSSCTSDEIAEFQRHFDSVFHDAYDWNLWGAAYLIDGGCSDDGFIDFRYGLISRGQQLYEAALREPDSLADSSILRDDADDESYGYVAAEVYKLKTGEKIPRGRIGASDPRGEDWDFDDEEECRRHLPKLSKKFL